MNKNFKYIFGPVYSWRLGMSLGIDPISTEKKTCNFDCSYCQLGKTYIKRNERQIFVPTSEVLSEVQSAPRDNIDFYTFSGKGEPTLAKNLGELIKGIRLIRDCKIAVITNSSLINNSDVRQELSLSDFVLVKLDCCGQDSLEEVNNPCKEIFFENIYNGLKKFRSIFDGKLALQIMFINSNIKLVNKIAGIAKEINPDEIQINTPLRVCDEKPIDKEKLLNIKDNFNGLKTICVYDYEKVIVDPINDSETSKRHGKYK